MSLAEACDAIAGISDATTHAEVIAIAKQCEPHLGNANEILDALENTLSTSTGTQRLMLWFLVDRLAKQHTLFCDALRPKLTHLCTHYGLARSSAEWSDFITLLKSSLSVTFGQTIVSLILLQLGEDAKSSLPGRGGGGGHHANAQRNKTGSTALTVHSKALRTAGAFMTKAIAVERSVENKHALQVKTMDSQMAMNVASSYAPARPVEIVVPEVRPDADAPRGFMQALPEGYMENYQETRRKRLREMMEKSRDEQDRKQEQEMLQRVRQDAVGEISGEAATATPGSSSSKVNGTDGAGNSYPDYSDIQMPLEFPRDEFGVKRGNFPMGVRFIRDAIAACGGAIELDVLTNRISTLANREAVAEFGNVREFLLIHSPTFNVVNEGGQWVVRLVGDKNTDEATWKSLRCPACSKVVRGRNFARHLNCRQCITAQIALGLQDDAEGRGPIAELAYTAKRILAKRESCDDGDFDAMADCLQRSAEIRRFRLASTRQFAPVIKAMRVVRDGWLARKGVEEVADAEVTPADVSVGNLFRVFGENIHRLPIAWIEMGDVIDMCCRFTDHVKPPFNPPPRPADPRISLQNEYPGFLFCESEVDDEDAPSDNEDEFSDDEAPAFTFAPPVDVAESLFTAGFERDTKRLQHRMRTAPPMVLQRVLQTDGSRTQSEMYTEFARSDRRNFSRGQFNDQRNRRFRGGGGGGGGGRGGGGAYQGRNFSRNRSH
ncbi:hypothetical protein ABB37_05258 [Leptomonas pyrrhocoris]|uniref:Uncharacterized protein n=1 Tax=Leptomonas pyrrhocoris TaxID=157538 RepID=A0A0M9FZX9_LEPPY|nr:hypothetical protein ABB37_05258 [Leptomonas pyrrhocoris]KPA79413.1 hypothetical protein ABB37_05258 [Leptomonas pyrrhocoris]|eukprot:XP_015657852.1 hypothetical protein ABB37_05258 [Leptomonas pyrrhocoris]